MESFRETFVNRFDSVLRVLGYKLLDIDNPVYIKTVAGEIMHIITSKYFDGRYTGDSSKGVFTIWGGIATVYKKNITENLFSDNLSWMRGMRLFCEKNTEYFDEEESFLNSIQEFTFIKGNLSSLVDSLDYACELTEEFILSELEKIQTLGDCINFFEKYRLI